MNSCLERPPYGRRETKVGLGGKTRSPPSLGEVSNTNLNKNAPLKPGRHSPPQRCFSHQHSSPLRGSGQWPREQLSLCEKLRVPTRRRSSGRIKAQKARHAHCVISDDRGVPGGPAAADGGELELRAMSKQSADSDRMTIPTCWGGPPPVDG